jgi:hypothetical protein
MATVAAGAVTLLEASKAAYSNDQLKRGVVEIIIRESPIAEQLPWMTIAGNALKQEIEAELPTVSFRDVNETYTQDFGTDTERFWGTAILGGEVYVDNYLIKVRGNVMSVKTRQYAKKARAAALTLDKYVIDGTGTAKDFKGVNALITDGLGFSSSAGTNGAALTLDMLEDAEDQLRKGTPDAIWANKFHRTKITRLARSSISGVALIDITTDMFGRRVTTWNGTPIRILGDDGTGTQILGFDETQGSSNIASSMYFVKFGEDFLCGLLGAGGSFEVNDFGEIQSQPGHLGRIEFYPGLALFDKHSIVRLAGILKS